MGNRAFTRKTEFLTFTWHDCRRYLDFLDEMQLLSANERALYSGIGKEFLSLIETTDMQKVYKMPILYSFYNDGDIRLAVKDEDVIGNEAFKEHMKDILEYRTMEYYRRRYSETLEIFRKAEHNVH